jgi:hypothetical protein
MESATFGYTAYSKLLCLGYQRQVKNRYRKDTVLFETASDHLLMAGFAGGGVMIVMYFVLHEQTWQQVYSGVIIRFEILAEPEPGPSACSPQQYWDCWECTY